MIEVLFQYSGYITLIGFVTAFCSIAVWVFLPKNKAVLNSHADIPLKGDKR